MGRNISVRAERGFSFIGLLIAVAVLGIGLALAGEVWNTGVKRQREEELLFVGNQFRQAIGRYYENSPGVKQYPQKLEDLLEDQRSPVLKRYLRKIYLDPMTGKADWGLVKQGDRILGVYSQSTAEPFKVANFKIADSFFVDSGHYSDWRFIYAPLGVGGAPPDSSSGTGAVSKFDPNAGAPRGISIDQAPVQAANVPQNPIACNADRANDMRECRNATERKDCEAAATLRYDRCMAAAAATMPQGQR